MPLWNLRQFLLTPLGHWVGNASYQQLGENWLYVDVCCVWGLGLSLSLVRSFWLQLEIMHLRSKVTAHLSVRHPSIMLMFHCYLILIFINIFLLNDPKKINGIKISSWSMWNLLQTSKKETNIKQLFCVQQYIKWLLNTRLIVFQETQNLTRK